MGFVDPQTVHNPASGSVAPASWGDAVRDALIFLVDPPQMVASHSTTQNVSTATDTALSADTETVDSDSMHSTVTNNSRGTVVTAGKYDVRAIVQWDSDTTGRRELYARVNGTTKHKLCIDPAAAPICQNAERCLVLAAGDYVEIVAWQNSGTTRAPQLLEFSMLYRMR